MDAISYCKYIPVRCMDGKIFLCSCATSVLQNVLQRVHALAGHANYISTHKHIHSCNSTLLNICPAQIIYYTMAPTQSSVATIRHTHRSQTHSFSNTAHLAHPYK